MLNSHLLRAVAARQSARVPAAGGWVCGTATFRVVHGGWIVCIKAVLSSHQLLVVAAG
jgi:hypothetical protein